MASHDKWNPVEGRTSSSLILWLDVSDGASFRPTVNDDSCFYLHYSAVTPRFPSSSTGVGAFSGCWWWYWWWCLVVVPGGAGGGGGQGRSVSLPLTGTSLCLPVCQTYQRWSRIIPFLLPRRGDPVSPTCPPTRPTRETLPGETDDWRCLTDRKEWITEKLLHSDIQPSFRVAAVDLLP